MAADSQYDKFLIHKGIFWDAYMSDQGGNNLGRMYFWLKRDGIIDFDDLTKVELLELRALHRVFKCALKKLFSPHLFNFAYLANRPVHGHHCHWHLVPRYFEIKLFKGVTFLDEAWGKQWVSKKLDDNTAIAIGKRIMKVALELQA